MNKKIIITISDEMYNQIVEVMKKLGQMSVSETGRYAFSAIIKKELNSYIEIQKERLQYKQDNAPKSEFKTKKAKKVNAQEQLCYKLGGVITGDGEQKICTFFVYQELPGKVIDSVQRESPLNSLNEDMVEFQYESLTGKRGKEAKEHILAIIRTKN